MAGSWSPKPSLKDKSNQGDLVTIVPSNLHQHHSISVIQTCLHIHPTSHQLQNNGRCQGLAPDQDIRSEVRHYSKARIKAREVRVMGGPTPLTFTLIRPWIQKWQKFRINILISGLYAWEIRRIKAPTLWSMALYVTQRPYEDKPASPQGWGHQGCHHIPKLTLGLNSELLYCVPGLHPSPLCHPFLTRLPRGVGEEFGDGHHPGWYPHHTRWALQQH